MTHAAERHIVQRARYEGHTYCEASSFTSIAVRFDQCHLSAAGVCVNLDLCQAVRRMLYISLLFHLAH